MELWTFVDMNSYFATCEQQDRPELRGLPVGIAPVDAETTSFIAASYEAKAFGIKTGTRVVDARQLCPHIQVVAARPALYRQFHKKIVVAVQSVVPIHAVLSVDELVCAPWKNEATLTDALRLGAKIQDAIRDQVGEWMDCSIGLGPNIFLAKVASDLQKPRGRTVVTLDDIPHKLLHMKLTDWPGISHGMEARFHKAGVSTTAEMYRLRIEEMHKIFGGIEGDRWWKSLRGQYVDRPPIQRNSIGHSSVLAPEYRNPEAMRSVAFRNLEKAAERMRSEHFHAQRLEVHVMSRSQPYWSRKADFLPCNRTELLIKIMSGLWKPPTTRPHSVGIILQRIIPDHEVTFNMFDEPRRAELETALDRLNRRYGRTSVVHGCALKGAEYLSHERIPFGKPWELEKDEFQGPARIPFRKPPDRGDVNAS